MARTVIYGFIMIILNTALWGGLIYLFILLIRALRKYLSDSGKRSEAAQIKLTLGEAIRTYRTKRNMTQEFVAEQLGVSRQAVSRWESGASDPSTSNLLALAKLFGVSAQELLESVS